MGRRRGRRDPRHRSGLQKQRRGSKWQGFKNTLLIIGFVVMIIGLSLSGASDSQDSPADTEISDDADQDRIPDSWEESGETPDGTPLPDADSKSKDIYIQVVTASNVDPLTGRERSQLKSIWRKMPIGPSGIIDIHFVDDRRLDESVTIEGSSNDMDWLQSEYYDQVAPESCVYHTVMLVELTSNEVAGRGDAPGYFVMADGERRNTGSGYSSRVMTITHELLHNVVGHEMGRDGHTEDGWLSHSRDTYLSSQTRNELNSSGFAGPETYDGCEVP